MPKKFHNQAGVLHILVLLAAAGILAFLFISNTFEFRDKLFTSLFPKPPSRAAGPINYYGKDISYFNLFGQKDIMNATRNKVGTDGMYHSSGVAVDKSSTPNKIYVVDSGNSRILAFNGLDGTGPKVPDMVFGQPDFNQGNCNGDDNLGFNKKPTDKTLCLMYYPAGNNTAEQWARNNIEVDQQGNLYVPDRYNNRVLKYNQPFSADKIGGKGDNAADFVFGQDDFVSNGRNRGPNYGTVNAPDDHSLWLADPGGYGEPTASGVSVDLSGNVWISDNYNHRVLRFPSNSKNADLVIGQSSFTSQGIDCAGVSLINLCAPIAARVHPTTGELFVLENRPSPFKARILVFKPPFVNGMSAYKTITPKGVGWSEPTPYIFQATGFSFNPYKVGEYAQGELWVTEHWAKRVLLLDFDGNVVKVINSTSLSKSGGTQQYLSPCPSIDEGNRLFVPSGSVGFDSSNNVYIADEKFQTVYRFALPYNLVRVGSTTCLPDANGVLIPKGGNKLSSDTLGESVGLAVFGNQVIVQSDNQQTKAWNDYQNKPFGAPADVVMSGGITDRSLMSGAIDDAARLWTYGNWGQIRIFQLPLQGSGQIIWNSIKLYWADDQTEIPYSNLGRSIAFDKINKVMYFVDKEARILRVRNYSDFQNKLFVDMVLGQQDKTNTKCNQGLATPNAGTLCNIHQIKFDKLGNLYVVDNIYECQGNHRITVFMADDLKNATGMFPNLLAKKVFNAPDFNTIGVCSYNTVNAPGSPVTLAFNAKNQMVVGNDGYYGDLSQREKKQLWFYSDPLNKQTPDASIDIYMGTPGEMEFDAQDNLLIQDHTWYRVLMINLCSDPEWLSWLPNTTPVSTCAPLPDPTAPPTPTLLPSPSPTPTPTPTPTSLPTTSTVVISNISAQTTANSATITWTTNISSTSLVKYGTTTSLGNSTPLDTSLITNHSITLTGLTKSTKYYYQVSSKNSVGLETSSSINQFRTKNR